MSFNITYPAGGIIDLVRRIGNPVQVVPPPHLFATYPRPFVKGFRLDIPATPDDGQIIYPIEYAVPGEMELLSIEVGCTGYSDLDYWNFYIDSRIACETVYTKEISQVKNFGAVKLVQGIPLRLEFFNNSHTSKVVWADFNFAVPIA